MLVSTDTSSGIPCAEHLSRKLLDNLLCNSLHQGRIRGIEDPVVAAWTLIVRFQPLPGQVTQKLLLRKHSFPSPPPHAPHTLYTLTNFLKSTEGLHIMPETGAHPCGRGMNEHGWMAYLYVTVYHGGLGWTVAAKVMMVVRSQVPRQYARDTKGSTV